MRFFAPILLTLRAENVYCLRNRLKNLMNALANPNVTAFELPIEVGAESVTGGWSEQN